MTTLNPTSKADLGWYQYVMVPLWKQQQQELVRRGVHYRRHLLALECLNRAKGPGGDSLKLAESCARFKSLLTLILPVIGPAALIRKIGRASGLIGELIAAMRKVGGPGLKLPPLAEWGARTSPLQALSTAWPQIAVFDITSSINTGINVLAAMAPLLGHIQMQQAKLLVLDPNVVPPGDAGGVGEILERARTPQALLELVKQQQKGYVAAWADLFNSAETIENARVALGLPEDSL